MAMSQVWERACSRSGVVAVTRNSPATRSIRYALASSSFPIGRCQGRMSVVIRDITAGASAHPLPEALLGAWTGSAAFVYCRDLSGKICAANEAFTRKFGRPIDQFMGKAVAGYVHLDDA